MDYNEEPTSLNIAKHAAKAGNAGHWPTVAGILLDEVERLECQTSRVRQSVINWRKECDARSEHCRSYLNRNRRCSECPRYFADELEELIY